MGAERNKTDELLWVREVPSAAAEGFGTAVGRAALVMAAIVVLISLALPGRLRPDAAGGVPTARTAPPALSAPVRLKIKRVLPLERPALLEQGPPARLPEPPKPAEPPEQARRQPGPLPNVVSRPAPIDTDPHVVATAAVLPSGMTAVPQPDPPTIGSRRVHQTPPAAAQRASAGAPTRAPPGWPRPTAKPAIIPPLPEEAAAHPVEPSPSALIQPTASAETAPAGNCRPYTSPTNLLGDAVPVSGIACRGGDGVWRITAERPLAAAR
jgi:hypothetical protein